MSRVLLTVLACACGLACICCWAPALAAAADGAAPSPAAAPATVAFGIITLAADRHSLTIVDAQGVATTLAITAKTVVTLDLTAVGLDALTLDRNVRVTWTGAAADAIDQLSPDKKKKKKKTA